MRLQGAIIPAAAAVAVVFIASFAPGSAKADTVQFTVVDGVNAVTFDLAKSSNTVARNVDFVSHRQCAGRHFNGYKSALGEKVDFYAANGGVELSRTGTGFTPLTSDHKGRPVFYRLGIRPTFVPGIYSGKSAEA